MQLIRTNAKNREFINLVALLDSDLARRDGQEHTFYDQFNKIDTIKYAVLIFEDKLAVGCGAIKEFDATTMEIKRMYIKPSHRRKGLAIKMLQALENWAGELGYQRCILETGKRQPEAVFLYKKCGYTSIPNYGQYQGISNSLCFSKML